MSRGGGTGLAPTVLEAAHCYWSELVRSALADVRCAAAPKLNINGENTALDTQARRTMGAISHKSTPDYRALQVC